MLVEIGLITKDFLWSFNKLGAAAGAMAPLRANGLVPKGRGQKSRKKVNWPLYLLACLLMMSSDLSAQLDSLRGEVVLAYQAEKRINANLNTLLDHCGDDFSCIEEQITWAATIADTLHYQVLERIGYRSLRGKRPQEALRFFHRGYATAIASNQVYQQGGFLNSIGYVYAHTTLQPDSAAHYLYRAIEVWDVDYPNAAWRCFYSLAHVYKSLDQADRCLEAAEQAYVRAREGGHRMDYGFALFHLLQFAFYYGKDSFINRYWPAYLELRNTAKKIDEKHDVLLEYLRGDDLALQQLADYLKRVAAGITKEEPPNIGYLYSTLSTGYKRRGQIGRAIEALREGIARDNSIRRMGNLVE
ncbi:MAG: hypothetical protein AAGA31_07990, partial [Bacteroidota bacterium]